MDPYSDKPLAHTLQANRTISTEIFVMLNILYAQYPTHGYAVTHTMRMDYFKTT